MQYLLFGDGKAAGAFGLCFLFVCFLKREVENTGKRSEVVKITKIEIVT